ncbi:hypothetical protein LTR49_020984 [Elasticomyces elasticus]|nr:hypothetical protein LTR49_020984 [Elasticomyces elasticus]
MAPTELTEVVSTGPKRPSSLAIAFAFAVVTSKPAELSVKGIIHHSGHINRTQSLTHFIEYIGLLRQHIAKGHRGNAISSTHRHLDRSSHWRSEYERVKDALRTSEGEAVDLKMEVEKLKARVESAKAAASAPKKRKKADEDVILVPRSPKRAKRDVSPGRKGGRDDVDVEKEFDFAEVGDIGNELMRSLYQVHVVLKRHDRTEPAVLAYHLVQAASALPQVVHAAVKASFTRLLTGQSILKTTLTAAGKAVVSLVVGINRLSHVTTGKNVQGQVMYSLVHMFASLLGTLEKASEFEAEKAARQANAAAAVDKRPKSSKGKAVAQPKQPNLKDIPSLNLITCFLCGIIDVLDPKVEIHTQLFEGFAYSTLDKLGARLYSSVFGHARGPSIEDEIMASNKPDEIEDSGPNPSPSSVDMNTSQVKMEAPYLVHLLTKMMNAAPTHFGAIISNKTGKAKQPNNKGSMKGALAIHAKDRLQRTLVNCIFGTEGVDEEDPFMDCLKMPSLAGQQPLPMPKIREPEVQEWFKGEVWRLLGWEILGKEGGW